MQTGGAETAASLLLSLLSDQLRALDCRLRTTCFASKGAKSPLRTNCQADTRRRESDELESRCSTADTKLWSPNLLSQLAPD